MGLVSGIRKKPIPDPGGKKAPDPGSGFATLGACMDSVIKSCMIPHYCEKQDPADTHQGQICYSLLRNRI
jgi:hypothetical protein